MLAKKIAKQLNGCAALGSEPGYRGVPQFSSQFIKTGTCVTDLEGNEAEIALLNWSWGY